MSKNIISITRQQVFLIPKSEPMDAKEIIKGIDEFFATASEEAKADVYSVCSQK